MQRYIFISNIQELVVSDKSICQEFSRLQKKYTKRSWGGLIKNIIHEESFKSYKRFDRKKWYSVSDIEQDDQYMIIANHVWYRPFICIQYLNGNYSDYYIEYYNSHEEAVKRSEELLEQIQKNGYFIVNE